MPLLFGNTQKTQLFPDQPLEFERSSFVPEQVKDLLSRRRMGADRNYSDHITALPDIVHELSPRLKRALEWSAYAHQPQRRYVERLTESGEYEFPLYLEHPYIVMAIAAQVTDDEDILIACLLHDVIEDQPDRMSLDMIEREFGPRVKRIVRDVTKDKTIINKGSRNANYLEHINTDACEEARIVCMADKIHNIMCDLDDYQLIGEELWEKFNKNGESVEETKVRKFTWFNGVYHIMLLRMPYHPLTHVLGEMVAMYDETCFGDISLPEYEHAL